jgi:DNA-binding MltR family transcriptional regulator
MEGRPEPRSLNDARKAFPYFSEMIDQIVVLDQGKADFANVLIASTLLDHVLILTLKSKMNGDAKFIKDLFSHANGVLGTLSSRIRIGWAMGLYNEYVYKGMDKVRDIRNTFAHTPHDLTFKNAALVRATKDLTEIIWDNHPFDSNNAAGEFIHAVASLIFKLEPLIAPQYRNAEALE